MKPKNFVLIALISLIFSSCGTVHNIVYDGHKTYRDVDSVNFGFSRQYPQTFTIYPFRNTSWYREAGPRAREAIFQGFSLIGACSRLEDTDKRVSSPYTGGDALKVAREENTDAVIMGEVTSQNHFYFIFFTYAYVELKLAVYDTKNGKLIWKGTTWSMSTDYGLSWISPVSGIIEHYYWSRQTMDLYHRVSMDFVHELRADVLASK
jgi:hypothetical protein